MSDFLVQSDCIVLTPGTDFHVVTENSDVTINENSLIFTESGALINTQVVEQTTSYVVLEKQFFVDFGGTGSRGGIKDAPRDSKLYVRKNGAWVELDNISYPPTQDSYLYEQVDLLNDFKQSGLGLGVDPKEKFVTINALLGYGVVKDNGSGVLGPTGPIFMTVPPTPKSFYVQNGINTIGLFWDSPFNQYTNHARVRVFRSITNNFLTSTQILNSTSTTGAVDSTAIHGVTYYYWIRFASVAGVLGAVNATAGTPGMLENTATNLLATLSGQIRAEQLDADLREPIELITATDGIIYQQQQNAANIIAETNNRISALTAETSARLEDIAEEALARENGFTSITNTITNNVENLQSQIDYTSSVTNGSFDTAYLWSFDTGTAEGWVATGGASVIVGNRLRPPFSVNTHITSPVINVDGATFQRLRMRIRKVGNPVWDGSVLFINSLDPDWSSASTVTIPQPTFFDGFATVDFDAINSPNWASQTVIGVRIQLTVSTDASNYFEYDWIGVGRSAPGASIAFVKQEMVTQSTAILAEAALREALAAQLRGSYTGTDIESVTSGILYSERLVRAAADDALSSQITALSAGTNNQFDHVKIYYFDATTESWVGNGGANAIVVPGWLRPRVNATDSYVTSPASLGVDSVKYPQVRARIRKVNSPVWIGQLWWRRLTTDATFDGARSISFSEPTWDADGIGYITVTPPWDQTINQIRIKLGALTDGTHYYELDWVAFGRPSPGASSAELAAEILTRTNADSALSSSITTLTTSVADKASNTSVDTLTSRVDTAEGNITSQGTKLTQLDSQMFPTLINTNPSLITTIPPQTYPDEWTPWDLTGVNPYAGVYAYTSGVAWRMVCTAGVNAGLQYSAVPAKVSNHAFVDVELIFTVIAGTTLSGAGLLFDWINTAATGFRAFVPLKDIIPIPEFNKKYVIKYRVQRPANFTGTFSHYHMWLMGNYVELGATSNHTIIYDTVKTFGADASASAISILDSRVTSAEGVNTSQASSLLTLRAQLAQNTNAVNMGVWVPGTSGSQNSGEDLWQENWSTGVVNSIVTLPGPFGSTETQWQGVAGTDSSAGSGGFNVSVPGSRLSRNRGAVFYAFIKQDGSKPGSLAGGFYFGPQSNQVTNLSNVVNDNPYFISGNSIDTLVPNEWYLVYGVIQPLGSTQGDSGVGGIYHLATGNKILAATEFRAHTNFDTVTGMFRSYLFYSNQSGRKVWWTRINIVPADSAPSPYEIMAQDKRLPATATALSNLTATVTDSVTGLAATVARTNWLEANVPTSSGNLIPYDTEFTTTGSEASWVNATRNLAGMPYVPYGLGQIGHTIPGTSAVNFDMYNDSPIPITQDRRYGFSVYTAAHRCVCYIEIEIYDANDSYLGNFNTTPLAGSGGSNLADWEFTGGFFEAPPGAAYCFIWLHGVRDSGESNPYMWLCRPMLTEASPVQTTLPAWSSSSSFAVARIAAEETVRATADSALALSVTNVTTTVNGHTSTIAVQQSSINGISAEYMVKLDVNGYVSGFGLYNSAGSSSFIINADKFAVGKPGATGIFPFIVDTTNNRVAMDGAYIKNASIDNAKIANLNASKIIAGTITTDKLQVGAVTAKQTGTSTNQVVDMGANSQYFSGLIPPTITFTPSGNVEYTINAMMNIRLYNLPLTATSCEITAYIVIDGNQTDVLGITAQVLLNTVRRADGTMEAVVTLPLFAYATNSKITAVNHTVGTYFQITIYQANGTLATGTTSPMTRIRYGTTVYVQENKV